ncbi:MAG: HEAT repeat domain-containing protein [Planctomycetota bacterium]
MSRSTHAPLLVACLGLPACSTPRGAGGAGESVSPGAVGRGAEASALQEIARLEDQRSGERELFGFLDRDRPSTVRARAALALGRTTVPEGDSANAATSVLIDALDDPASDVRAAAAFALGQRGDAQAAQALLDHWLDPEPDVRAQIVRAAGSIDEPRLRAKVIAAMRSPLENLRLEAVSAPFAWPTDDIDARAVDLALSEVASRVARGSLAAERLELPNSAQENPEIVWRALFSLQRRKSAVGRNAYHAHLNDPRSPLARLFAAKGLAQIEPHDAGRVGLEAALFDADWRVAVEAARGLGNYGDQRSLDALEEALENDVFHVRVAVAVALGAFRVGTGRATGLAARLWDDPSSNVRAAALVARAKLHFPLARDLVRASATDEDAVVRAGAARAAAELPSPQALPLLLQLTRDEHPRVAGTAVAALARHASPEAHARLVELIGEDDNGLQVAAIDALGTEASLEDIEPLLRAYSTAQGDIAADVRNSAMRALKAIDEELVRDLLVEGTGVTVRVPPLGDLPELWDPGAPNPLVEIVTTRGTLLFELFPREAPVHVHNFLQLAGRDYYDGLDFHRVVGDFVIQGGCYRGDGNGSGTWRAADDALRHEFGRRRTVRGSLAMPRGAQVDSGGSQIFVTHRPTPHLDGRYTIFGELREGAEVLDAMQVGDRILDVRRR